MFLLSSHLAVGVPDHNVVRLEVPVDDAGAVHEADAGDDLGEEEADPDVVHLVEELLQEVVAQRLPEHALHHEDGATAAPAVRVEEGGEQSGEGRRSSS